MKFPAKRFGRAPFFLKPTKSGSNGLENPEKVIKSTFKHLLQGQFALSKHAPPSDGHHFPALSPMAVYGAGSGTLKYPLYTGKF